MTFDFLFFLNSVLLGIGLAMDAFSVSAANGLAEPGMKRGKIFAIAATFGVFQMAMPLIGWVCVHTVAERFSAFATFIPWIALALLCFIGGKMIVEGVRGGEEEEVRPLGLVSLLVQGVATSIDALSVGFTIESLPFSGALVECLIIGVVTSLICVGGVAAGRVFGTRLSGKANVIGGVILVAIGLEIFITGVFF